MEIELEIVFFLECESILTKHFEYQIYVTGFLKDKRNYKVLNAKISHTNSFD